MTFVVTENCIKCKYTDCVEVCNIKIENRYREALGRLQSDCDKPA